MAFPVNLASITKLCASSRKLPKFSGPKTSWCTSPSASITTSSRALISAAQSSSLRSSPLKPKRSKSISGFAVIVLQPAETNTRPEYHGHRLTLREGLSSELDDQPASRQGSLNVDITCHHQGLRLAITCGHRVFGHPLLGSNHRPGRAQHSQGQCNYQVEP